MGAARRVLDLMGMAAGRPGHLRKGLQAMYESFEMERRRQQVLERWCLPDGLPTVCILDLLGGLDERVDPYSFLYGMSPPLDIALLNGLAKRHENCSYLEIGSWRGESLANVARLARECVSVSLSPEEMRRFGATDNEVETSGFFTKGLPNVTHIGHNSQTFDFSPYEGRIDLVFVDGDHSYEGVRSDTRSAYRLLRNDDSVIVWHDYGLTPETVNWRVLAGILDGAPDGAAKDLYHVSNTLCAIYSRKSLPSRREEFAQLPTRRFSVGIRGERIRGKNLYEPTD